MSSPYRIPGDQPLPAQYSTWEGLDAVEDKTGVALHWMPGISIYTLYTKPMRRLVTNVTDVLERNGTRAAPQWSRAFPYNRRDSLFSIYVEAIIDAITSVSSDNRSSFALVIPRSIIPHWRYLNGAMDYRSSEWRIRGYHPAGVDAFCLLITLWGFTDMQQEHPHTDTIYPRGFLNEK